MSSRPRRPAPLARRPALAWLLAAMLVLAQAAGLVHGVAHGPGSVAGHGHAQPQARALAQAHALIHGHGAGEPCHPAAGQHSVGGPQVIHGLDGHAPGSAECRLLDQLLAPVGLLPAPAGLLPVLAPARALRVADALRPGLPAPAAYQARAPPRG